MDMDRFIRPDAWDATERVIDEQHRITVRDLEITRDRMFTRLALCEPLHELRKRLRREEGL